MRALLLAAILLLPMAAAASPPLEPDISLELAQWRSKHYRDVRYAMHLNLVEGSDRIAGSLQIDFKFHKAYLYTLLVPADASTLFPCFDQPDLKSRFSLELKLPRSWIEAALGSLNAPEQAALTRPALTEALARLPELKRTRKIFFVGNWLGAFIGGQTGPGALAEIESFLKRGDIDADLRLKILEATDGLERAVRIRERFGARSADE